MEWYMIFDVKVDFTHKTRFVANASISIDLWQITCDGYVFRDNVRIDLAYSVLNDIEIMAVDIYNAYMKAMISMKYWMVLGS